MPRNWAVNYARNKELGDEDIRWRLRDWKYHPYDPGWERGECSKCHEDWREKASEGDLVFDVVFPKSAQSGEEPRVVRSVFRIDGKGEKVIDGDKEKVLEFNSYYFLDDHWKEGILERLWRNYGKRDRDLAEKRLSKVRESSAYNEYKVGQKPSSIPKEHWETMVEKGPG